MFWCFNLVYLVFTGHKQLKTKEFEKCKLRKAISICISILISCLIMETFWGAQMCWRGEHVRWGEQHTRDTIRLVPLHLMLLSWMQNAEKERLFEKNNKLQTEKWASFKKIVFRSKKLLFQPFLKTTKIKMAFWSNFFPFY